MITWIVTSAGNFVSGLVSRTLVTTDLSYFSAEDCKLKERLSLHFASNTSNTLDNIPSNECCHSSDDLWTYTRYIRLWCKTWVSAVLCSRDALYIGERNGAQRRTKVDLCWSCCGWQKGTSLDELTLNSEEIKPVAVTFIELHLSEYIT